MAGIWIPGVEVIAGVDGGAFVGAPWRGVLHTTQGPTADGAISTFQGNNFWPHFTVDFNAARIVQHLSLDVAARALEVHTVQTNRANCVQLELVGFAADTPSWSSDQIEFIGDLMRAIEARVPIPRQSTVLFKTSPQADTLNNGVRLSANDWLAYSGWCGHQHVPENVHGDPGLIDIGYLCSPHLLGVGSTQSSPGPAAVPRTPYVLDVAYARGNSPYAEGWSSAWDGVSTQVGDGNHAPATAAGVALTARHYDVLDAFWVTEQNNLFTSFWTRAQGWSTTEAQIGDPSVTASTAGGIAALARQPDILDVFFVGLDNRLHTTWWTADQGWSPTTLLIGGPQAIDATGGVSAVNRARDVIDVFAVGQDALLYTTWWTENGGWNNGSIAIAGQSVPVNPVSGVAALARRPNNLDVIYIGDDANLYAVSWSPSTGWVNPTAIGGPVAPAANKVAGVAVVSRRPDVIDVFWIGQDKRLHTTWWTDATGWNPGSLQIGDPAIDLSGVATPAAVARQETILDVFVADENGNVLTVWWTQAGGWNPAYLTLDL
ncbi:MAG: N-acetylmuramoyl-L-alanine amidase [Actinomycetota bacterium]|nr:N-acetylmuramoyl-L-alanine amidase [Actinomycetota bacterium]